MKQNVIFLLLIVFMANSAISQVQTDIDLDNGWELKWSDEFDYPDKDLEKNWTSQNGSSGGVVICSRWRENAEVHDGILELKAKKENRGDQDWTCGNIWTNRKFGYGYFECRYKYAGATGTNNSFWLWPRYKLPDGEKAFELDINEGHYPNIVNTNIHNWTDKHEDGSHDDWPKRFALGGIEPKNGYTHIFDNPVTTNKIRFSSTNGLHFHVGEFRVYAPNAAGYPANEVSETADNDVAGLINYSRDPNTTISASGQYIVDGRNTDPQNVGDGSVAVSWIAQKEGEKWLEITFSEAKEVGCVQFTNGWLSGSSTWNALISNYKLQYHDGSKWVDFVDFDIANGTDFSEEYHTYGFLWDEKEFKFYFDGELLRTESHTECHSETNILLSLAILDNGIAGAVTDAIDGTSMKIDYVRYYNYDKPSTVNEQSKREFIVYPNPVGDKLNFENADTFNTISFYNSQGKILLQEALIKECIDISSFTSGVYFYVAKGSNEVSNGRFVKN